MAVIISGRCGASAYFLEGIFRCDEVISAADTELIHAPTSVLIAGEDAQLPCSFSVFAAVVDADSGFDAEMLRGTAVLTCGVSGRNTVSMTSRTPERVTLSLNRSVTTLRGVCEPFELPVQRLPDTTDFDCMAAFAAAVVLGAVES